MNIEGKPLTTIEKARDFALSKGATRTFVFNALIYWDYCNQIGVNPEVAYMQYALETGFGKFGGVINALYCNPCGLKVPSGGGDYDANAHKRFRSWNEGIEAHVDHLALYCGINGYPKENTGDPRHFKYLFGTVKTTEQLAGTWASDKSYAVKLNKLINDMRNYKKKTN